jgi:hypothetical protein
MKNWRLTAACWLLALLSACSFTLAKLDEPYRPDVEDPPGPYCDTERVKPVMDATASAAFLALLLRVAVGDTNECRKGDARCRDEQRSLQPVVDAAAIVSLAGAAIYGVAALIGFDRTRRCRDAIRDYEAAVQADRAQRRAIVPRPSRTNGRPYHVMSRKSVAAPQPPPALAPSYTGQIIVPTCSDGRRGVRILLGDPASGYSCEMDDGAPMVDLDVSAADIVAPASFDIDGATVCPGADEPCYTFRDASVHFDAFDAGTGAAGSFTVGTGSHQLGGTFSATWCAPLEPPAC